MDITYEENICRIYIDCFIYMDFGYQKCEKIMKKFLNNEKIYFELYKDDGLNINAFDLTKGEVEQYIKNDCGITIEGKNRYCGYLTNCDEMWQKLPSISKWYIETAFFESNKNSKEVVEFLESKPMISCEEIIQSNFATIIFAFVDSGDFLVVFDTSKYCADDIIKEIKLLFDI